MKKNSSKVKPTIPLTTINPDAAGIDIGSKEIYVCVPADRDAQFVRTFETFTVDLHALAKWLESCHIKTIAIESTGIYWVPLMEILEQYGFEVYLVNAKNLKNVSAKKSDVLDCQWLQQMHSYGLLRCSFRPEEEICVLRALVRHKDTLLQYRASHIQHMQKALHQMNLQLDNVISDITGVTGMHIMRAIVSGNHNPDELAQFRDPACKSSKEVIRKSLVGNYRKEHLFALKQSLELYDFYTELIQQCDVEIKEHYRELEKAEWKEKPMPEGRKLKRQQNAPDYDLRTLLYRTCGVDLTAIPGISVITAQALLSEIGDDLAAFPTSRHFCSWLALSPNNKITGGKILDRRIKKASNRATLSLRLSARSLQHSNSALGAYYRKMRAIHGPAKAIIATAHRLARIIYSMLTRRVEYDETIQQNHDARYKEHVLKNLKKRARDYGMELVPVSTMVS